MRLRSRTVSDMRHTHISTRSALVPAALLFAALALTGCSAQGTSTVSNQNGSVGAPQIDGGVVESEPVNGDFATSPDGSISSVDRQVVETGYATVVVDEPLDAASEATRITESVGGRVDSRDEYAPADGDAGSATLTLRIPSSELTETLDKLKELGTVQEVSLSSTDVTMQSLDLDSRITAMSASVERLLTLLSNATDTETLITLETAISDRQSQLESMQSQRRYLADQVAMSTLTLNLVSPEEAEVVAPETFLSGLQTGWTTLMSFFSGLGVIVGVLLPWLVLPGILAVIVIALVRRSRRDRVAAGAAADGDAAPADAAAAASAD